MKTRLIALGIATFIFATSAHTEEYNRYAGFQFTSLKFILNGLPLPTINPTMLVARYGEALTPYLAIEGRIGTGIQSDRITGPGGNASFEAGTFAGVYLQPYLELSSTTSIYAVAGYSSMNGSGSAALYGTSGTFKSSLHDSGGSYGLGFDIGMNGATFDVEYMKYLHKSDYDVKAYSIGMRFAF